jgi:amino acid transporter
MPHLKRELGLRDLILFNVAAVVSTRWIATAAHAGPGTLVLWAFAAVFFLVPIALTATGLAARYPEEGGIYVWTREAFGTGHGFACAWFYYLSNLFWVPSLLVASAGMIAYAFSEKSVRYFENPLVLVPVTLFLLALVIASNYVGLRVAKWVDNCGGLGAYLIWFALVASAAGFLLTHHSVTQFDLRPRLDWDKVNFWSQMAFGMTGLELSPILGGEIRNPRRTILRASWISAFLVTLFYMSGTAAILVLRSPDHVSPVVGLAEASRDAARTLGWNWVPLLVAFSILFSVGGQLGTYIGASARLPFVLGIEKLLPAPFARLHPRYGTPSVSILALGIGSAILLVISQLGETVRAAYQIMIDMSVITLFIPFLYLFAAGWKFGLRWPAASGFTVALVAIGFSFVPTADMKSVWLFEAKLVGGCLLLSAMAWAVYRRCRRPA